MDAKEATEAVKTLKQMQIQYYCELFEHRALKLAIEALEKQVPRKPVQKEDSAYGWAWYCANCGCFIDPSTYKFCQDCGQAIKKE